MTSVRDFVTTWGFNVEDAPLRRLDNQISTIQTSLSAVGRTALGLTASLAGGALGLTGIFKTMGEFEQAGLALEVMTGSAEKGRKLLQEVQSFSAKTPFLFSTLLDNTKRLMAFGMTADDIIPTLTSLGNIAAGVGTEKLPQLVHAFGQINAAGRLTGYTLREFVMAGVPLAAELAKQMGVPVQQIEAMAHAGQISFAQVQKALAGLSAEGGRFHDLMARQSKTLLGLFTTFKDNIAIVISQVGESGLLKQARGALASVVAYMNDNRRLIVEKTALAVRAVIDYMHTMWNVIKAGFRVFEGLIDVLGGTENAIHLISRAVALLTAVKVLTNIGKLTTAFIGVARGIFSVEAAAAAIPLAIGAAVAAVLLIIEDVYSYFQGRKSITGLLLGNMETIGSLFDKLIDPLLDKLKDWSEDLVDTIIGAFQKADWHKIGTAMLAALEALFRASMLPLQIGMAIADGIFEGLGKALAGTTIGKFFGINPGGPPGRGTVGEMLPTPPMSDKGIFGVTPGDLLNKFFPPENPNAWRAPGVSGFIGPPLPGSEAAGAGINATFNINGVTDPKEVARQVNVSLSQMLKDNHVVPAGR